MLSLKNIIQEIEETMTIKSIVTSYEQIASMKMRRIRQNVLSHRSLIMELADIYKQVWISYKDQLNQLMEQKKLKNPKQLSLREHNNKTACIFISAASGLFGTILQKTYDEFAKYIQENPVEPIIIGEYGRRRFMAQFPEKQFTYYPISDSDEAGTLTERMSEGFLNYTNIIIFFPKFESMVSQKAALLDVSGQQNSLMNEDAKHAYFFFEPSIEEIMTFFEKEIFANILGQTFVESRLARYASRMLVLDSTTNNINNRLRAINMEKNIAIHRKINKKQIELITGMSLWQTA